MRRVVCAVLLTVMFLLDLAGTAGTVTELQERVAILEHEVTARDGRFIEIRETQLAILGLFEDAFCTKD